MGGAIGLALGIGMVLVFGAISTDRSGQSGAGNKRHVSMRQRAQEYLRDLLIQAGAPEVAWWVFIGLCLSIAVLASAITVALTQVLALAILAGIGGFVLPLVTLSARARTIRNQRSQVWPEVVDSILSGVRAGVSLPEVIAQLGQRGPEVVRPQFQAFSQDLRASGRFEESLMVLKSRCADPVADRLVEALRIAHVVGGSDLTALLRDLSRILREDQRTRGELLARQSWTTNGARVAVAAPWVVLVLLCLRPQAAQAYSTWSGALVLGMGALVSVFAYVAMLRLGRLPEEVRTMR